MTDTLHGITALTPTEMLIDAGVLVRNYVKGSAMSAWDIVGATSGGASFSIEETIYAPKIDGAYDSVKGTERQTAYKVTLAGSIITINRDIITDVLPGSLYDSSDATYDKVTSGPITSADYLTNVSLLVTHSKNPALQPGAVLMVLNARGDGKLKIDTKHGEDAIMPFTYEGTVDPTAPQTAAYQILLPKGADVS